MSRNSIISGAISPEDRLILEGLLGRNYNVSEFINHVVQIVSFLDPDTFAAFMDTQPIFFVGAIEGALPKRGIDSCSRQF